MWQMFYSLTILASHLYLIKTESNFINFISSDWLTKIKTGGRYDQCLCLSFYGFLRFDLSPQRYRNRCFLAALYHLIVMKLNLEEVAESLLHQQVKIMAQLLNHVVHGSVSLQLFPVMWIFLRSLGVICCNRQVHSGVLM